jgi:predicted HAD superfamily Cof-like phosphohydrolase
MSKPMGKLLCHCGHEESLHVDGKCKGYHDNSYDPYDSDDDPCDCTEYMPSIDARRMDMDVQRQVIEFHQAFGHLISETPTADIPADRVRLRARLIIEETLETLEAMFDESSKEGNTALRQARELINSTIARAPIRVNLEKLADGCADVDVVIEGTRLEFGINGKRIAGRVHIANMAKLHPCPDCTGTGRISSTICARCKRTGKIAVNDAHGKTVKPEGWQPPAIAREIALQQDGTSKMQYGLFGLLVRIGR